MPQIGTHQCKECPNLSILWLLLCREYCQQVTSRIDQFNSVGNVCDAVKVQNRLTLPRQFRRVGLNQTDHRGLIASLKRRRLETNKHQSAISPK